MIARWRAAVYVMWSMRVTGRYFMRLTFRCRRHRLSIFTRLDRLLANHRMERLNGGLLLFMQSKHVVKRLGPLEILVKVEHLRMQDLLKVILSPPASQSWSTHIGGNKVKEGALTRISSHPRKPRKSTHLTNHDSLLRIA